MNVNSTDCKKYGSVLQILIDRTPIPKIRIHLTLVLLNISIAQSTSTLLPYQKPKCVIEWVKILLSDRREIVRQMFPQPTNSVNKRPLVVGLLAPAKGVLQLGRQILFVFHFSAGGFYLILDLHLPNLNSISRSRQHIWLYSCYERFLSKMKAEHLDFVNETCVCTWSGDEQGFEMLKSDYLSPLSCLHLMQSRLC